MKSFLFIGIGGSGKNHETLNLVKDKKVLCLSFENSAVNNLMSYCKKFGIENYKCMTLHCALGLDFNGDNSKKVIDFGKYEVIIIDEVFRTDLFIMGKLYNQLKNVNCIKIFIGDEDQNKYIGEAKYKYSECDFLKKWLNIEFICRYKNIETFEFIKYFRENKRFSYKLKELDLSLENNICYFNKTRINGNKKFSENFKIGDKAILKENYEKLGMFKNYEFIIEKNW